MPPRTRFPASWLILACAACGPADPGEVMVLRQVHRDVLADGAWEVVREAEGAPPRVDVVTPSIDNLTDAADRLALVVPPPAEVRFEITASDGEVWITPAAGVDLALSRELLKRLGPGASVTVDFELSVNGGAVHAASVTTHARAPRNDGAPGAEPHVWKALAGETGIRLEPGDRVSLRTSLPAPPPAGLGPIPAGFAGLELERRVERPRTKAGPGAPNIVLVVMDTERRDRTSTYGYGRETTPNLTRLAARGVRFDHAYSTASWTWPATASLLTGRQPEAHGVVDFRSCWLEDELVTLAESLQEAGLTTAGFSANPLISAHRNFDQGFEHFHATTECEKGDAIVPPALQWLEANREHRFFLYVHMHDPHVPHSPRPADLQRLAGVASPRFDPLRMQARTFELRGASAHTADDLPRPELLISEAEAAWYSDVYDACVATGDHWFGVLVDTLAEFGLLESTVVAYTSDHGEELLDHRMLNHNHDLWPELVRVPLVLVGPGIEPGVVAAPISNRHLAPTLAGLAGARLPGPEDAQDLARPGALVRRPVLFDTRHGWWKGRQFVDILGAVEDGWMVHWCPQGKPWDAADDADPAGGEVRLFELSTDPGARVDRAAAEPERAARMKELVLRTRARLGADRPARKQRAGEATMNLLREAGYAGRDDDEGDH